VTRPDGARLRLATCVGPPACAGERTFGCRRNVCWGRSVRARLEEPAAPFHPRRHSQTDPAAVLLRTGRPGTLLCRAPLRTRACPFPSTRLKQAVEGRMA
jgi:hypothetical protein